MTEPGPEGFFQGCALDAYAPTFSVLFKIWLPTVTEPARSYQDTLVMLVRWHFIRSHPTQQHGPVVGCVLAVELDLGVLRLWSWFWGDQLC